MQKGAQPRGSEEGYVKSRSGTQPKCKALEGGGVALYDKLEYYWLFLYASY